jgi:uncharacterized membrane protein YkvI
LKLKMAFIFGMFILSIVCIFTGIKDINRMLGYKAYLTYILIFFSFILPVLISWKRKEKFH